MGITLFDELQALGFEASYPTFDSGDPGPPPATGLRRLPAGPRSGRTRSSRPDLLDDLPEDKWNREIEPQEDDVPELVNLRQFKWDEEDIPESPVAPQAHEPFVDDRGGTPEQQQAAEGRQDPHGPDRDPDGPWSAGPGR